MKEEHNNAGMAIWLGNLLDVIPESFVIGTVMLSIVAAKTTAGMTLGFWDVMPLTLVGALTRPEIFSGLGDLFLISWWARSWHIHPP
jgi:hypothetical protein